ncbi:hypothetical protein GQ600_20726 [Phytophthora cactorum]|nr:hypothetical protein GQ600_20726 [Phytophthora cactorum]
MLTEEESTQAKELLETLFDFQEVSKALQDPTLTMVGVRRAFDWVVRQYPSMTERLASDAAVVNYPVLETGITKIISGGRLTTREQEACKGFKSATAAPPTEKATRLFWAPVFQKVTPAPTEPLQAIRGGDYSSPINGADLVMVEPFSPSQMSKYFCVMDMHHSFSSFLQTGIMKLSGGVPGVLGSLVRFTVDVDKCMHYLVQWEQWFFGDMYSKYLQCYNTNYYRIQQDLQQLNDVEWLLLKQLIEKNGNVTAIDGNAERLLGMGVVTERRNNTLAVMSPIMERICLEALSTRKIRKAVAAMDPIQLLSVASNK